MKLSKRQKKYREYLASEHWSLLRARALERDGYKCVECGETGRLQVHHHRYPEDVKDSSLDDVKTLCSTCHKIEHGYGSSRFERLCEEIERYFHYQKRPPIEMWQKIKELNTGDEWDLFCFGELMFKWTCYLLPFEKYGYEKSWWMVPEIRDYWWDRAFNVRKRITERCKHVR